MLRKLVNWITSGELTESPTPKIDDPDIASLRVQVKENLVASKWWERWRWRIVDKNDQRYKHPKVYTEGTEESRSKATAAGTKAIESIELHAKNPHQEWEDA